MNQGLLSDCKLRFIEGNCERRMSIKRFIFISVTLTTALRGKKANKTEKNKIETNKEQAQNAKERETTFPIADKDLFVATQQLEK